MITYPFIKIFRGGGGLLHYPIMQGCALVMGGFWHEYSGKGSAF